VGINHGVPSNAAAPARRRQAVRDGSGRRQRRTPRVPGGPVLQHRPTRHRLSTRAHRTTIPPPPAEQVIRWQRVLSLP
jgi:hypothetical protein